MRDKETFGDIEEQKKLKYILIETAESDYFRYNQLSFELAMFKSVFY
jgi:hypothetical protein